MTTLLLTQARLKELVHYDPNTGKWLRLKSQQRPDSVGREPGYMDWRGRHMICIDGKEYFAHRLAYLYMTGIWPAAGIDHKDSNENDWCNLRPANQSQNVANSRLSKANTSGYKGVTWDRRKKKWRAQIGISGKNKILGRFGTAKAAHEAYMQKAVEAFGEFARSK